MYRLPPVIVAFLMVASIFAQSPHGDNLKISCNQCHNPSGWEIDVYLLRFNHDKTDFALEGSHAVVDCKACHSSLVFSDAPNQCASCHNDIHSGTVGNDCAQCHTPSSWLVDNIPEIHEENGFPLIGAHSNLSCAECHTSDTNLRFDNLGNECINCHREDYLATEQPSHTDSGFSTNCIECHSPIGTDWSTNNAGNHDFFPLTLGHDIQNCTQCHTTGNYADADPACVSCHQSDFDATTNPNHGDVGFPTDCVQCHTTNPGWTTANINHDFFPLTLGHDIQDCAQCHTTGNYADADPACVNCHLSDFDATTNPNHGDVGFPTDCVQCHTTNPGWTPATINHDFFPLTLGHDIQDCAQCHTTGNYADADPACVSCHQSDFDATTNPNHSANGFPTDCATCHTTNPGWTPATINHDFFPLTLGHDIQDCAQCHTTGNYSDVDPNCATCHQSDYDATTNPVHSTNGFPTDCVVCHTTNSGWTPATINHDFFPLTLGHDIQDCAQCHTTGNYADADPNCVTCHQSDYDGTTNPVHSDAQFSTDCVTCHTTNPNWTPVTWSHNDFYPLNGAHALIADNCAACHNGNYVNTPNTCVGCHQSDYDTTTDPNHLAAQFPTDCAECHTEQAWIPSTFDHDSQYFRIYSGTHAGTWNSCSTCHTNANDYSVFSCFACHAESVTNSIHDHPGEPAFEGYVYDSNACLECHPN